MKCSCGFPIRPVGRTMLESFLGAKRIIVEHEQKCPKCQKINKVKG
jgi:hypothetical protein